MEHVHNRRQKSMINTLFNIGARAFAIETRVSRSQRDPASRYRRVIIYR